MPLDHAAPLPWPPAVGDALPGWTMPSTLGRDLALSDFLGRPLVLLFLTLENMPALQAELAAYARRLGDFQKLGVNVAGVLAMPAAQLAEVAAQTAAAFPLLADVDGSVTRAYQAYVALPSDAAPRYVPARKTFVADAGLRVIQVEQPPAGQPNVAGVLACLERLLAREAPRQVRLQAPVLLIPNVLPAAFCQELIQVWETQGNEESGFMKDVEGKTVAMNDYAHKIRRDHFMPEGPLRTRVMRLIFHRVKPQIQKAYNFNVTRFEDLRIACYDASRGGYFRPHRDNSTAGTAHRVFAMSLNLNAGDYEGGYLRFPEYGPHLYRPEIGEAVIFSCSLIHEATDVTAGRRFVLLTFLYGEAQARAREAEARRTGGDYHAQH